MSDSTKAFIIRVAAITVALLVLLFAFALYRGTASVPGEVQTAAWGLLVAAIGAGSVYLNTRSNAVTRANSDKNAQETQAQVAALHSAVQQQPEIVAAKVAEVTAQPTLVAIEQHTAEIAKNTDPQVLP